MLIYVIMPKLIIACSVYGERRGVWWGNLREQRPLGRHRHRWGNNIIMDLQEVGCGSMEWI